MAAPALAGGRSHGDGHFYEEERIVGYDLKCRYEGRIHHTPKGRDPVSMGAGAHQCGRGRISNRGLGKAALDSVRQLTRVDLCD